MSQDKIQINLEFTPNPNTLKFVVNRSLVERGAANFTHAGAATHAPLAKKLFEIPGVQGVMFGTNFVTITKALNGDWDVLAEQVPLTIEDHLSQGLSIFDEQWTWETPGTPTGEEGEIERKIREVLDNEIRPAVAMDGGDITFGKYENGVAFLHLQGSCSSCPSSIMTLKMGVESRLKEVVPQLKEVVQI